MASMGLQGGTARCYDWYMDFLKVRASSQQGVQDCSRAGSGTGPRDGARWQACRAA